ncbi:MAG: ribosome silencing factor [Spirochaetaceae bacterium]|jgi:ribosome-associated protein|nr:ribosome silencing factor [Spirochaetaceae bacterium]
MGDMLPVNDGTVLARNLSALLQDHKGKDVAVLDLREFNSWTDFFVITTVSSQTHLMGLLRHIKEFCRDGEIEIFGGMGKIAAENEWTVIDLGTVVVHLMTEKARSFYELERLWSTGRTSIHHPESETQKE